MSLQGKYAQHERLSPHRRLLPVYNQNAALGKNLFIAPNSTVVGKAEVKDGSVLWYGTVVRGDSSNVCIGKNTNIGDLTVVHVPTGTTDSHKTVIGSKVYIGSSCVLSGCTIHDEAFLGNSVIVREGAEVGASKIEHGSLVETGTKIPAGQLWGGNPAVFVRDLTTEEITEMAALHSEVLERSEKHTYWHELTAEERAHVIATLEATRYFRADQRAW